MQLTGKQIIERGIVKNYCEEGIQQQGIDVRVEKIFKTKPNGVVPREGKTYVPQPIELTWGENDDLMLEPGYYEVELMESCDIPNNAVLKYETRSSLIRCGAQVRSGQFDAGFKTDRMGCFLKVENTMGLQKGARIAQAIVNETYPVDDENLYQGQWQGDSQRNRKN